MESEREEKEYDVAISYAREDSEYVHAIAHALRHHRVTVFLDVFEEAKLIGRNLIDYLVDVYR